MKDSSTTTSSDAKDADERQLREINEALLVSSVRQHELLEQAQKAETALRESEKQLALELAATQRLQEISAQLIREENVQALYEQILDAAAAIMHSDMASMQIVDEREDALRMQAWRGFGPEFGKIFELVRPDRKTSCSVARRVGHRIVVPDVETCDFIVGTPALEDLRKTGIRAVQSTPLVSRAGRVLGMISTHWRQVRQPSERDLRLLDVLARQAADLIERSQAEEALREADRRKDEFLAMLGHELRNPLGVISTSMQLLRRVAPRDMKMDDLHDTIERQVIHTSQMLDDLLDISRISRGKIQLKKQRWDLRDLVRQTTEDYRGMLDDNGLRLELHLPDEPCPIFGDRTRLSQALGNLLHNACKFTERDGAVTVKLDTVTASVVLSVTDTGIGMEADALNWVFDPFRQADRTLDRSRGGLGLGLALVKGIVQLHGGEVTASSDGIGRGSTFTIQLPLDHSNPPSSSLEPNQERKTSAYRVLVIEDNPAAAQNIQRLLEMSGHSVETAHSGPDGVEAARRFRPKIVLCDIGLPGLDGYRVARALRQDVGLTEACLIAVSGYTHDESRARQAGFDAHILKPVNFEKLEQLIELTCENIPSDQHRST